MEQNRHAGMTAKDYLQQVYKLNIILRNKQVELEQWQSIATGTTAPVAADKVQTSGSQDIMANAVCEYVDIERSIKADIVTFAERRQEIIKTIEQLPTDEYDVLHMIYVQFKSIEDVAEYKHKSYSWAASIHKSALEKVQTIIDRKVDRNGVKKSKAINS